LRKLIRNLRLYASYAITCAFALFGLVNPQSKFDVLQIFLFTFLISYLLYSQQKRNRAFLTIWALTLFTALVVYFIYHRELFILVPISILAGVIYFFILEKAVKNLNNIFVAHLIVFFLLSAYFNSYSLRTIISREPAPKSYFNDYLGFLRNFYLVERGYGYYEGLVITHSEDGRSSTIPQKVWNWRLPTYAYLWKILPGTGGLSVYVFFLALPSVALYFTYRIGRVFLNPNQAVLVPYVLLPYFHYAARDLSFLEMEWWALPFLILAVFAIFKKRLNLLIITAALAMLLRETFLIPMLIWSALMVISKNYKMARTLTFAVAIFLIALALHYFKVTQYISRSWDALIFGSKLFDLNAFQQTLSYGSIDYLFFRFRPFLVSLVFAVLLLATSFYRRRVNWNLLLVPLTALSMTIFTLKFASIDADYWGVTYVSLLLISIVFLLFSLINNEGQTKN